MQRMGIQILGCAYSDFPKAKDDPNNTKGEGGNKERVKKGSIQSSTRTQGPQAITLTQKVVEGGKDMGYFLVIVAAAIVLGLIGYQLFGAFFLSTNPHKVFDKACSIIKTDSVLNNVLGGPIKCKGIRQVGRRKEPSATKYFNRHTNSEHIVVSFRVAGSQTTGEVHVDVKLSTGKFYSMNVELPSGAKYAYTKENKFERR
jgi:hypothetical protein